MFTFIRQSPKKFRPWLIAAGAILLLTSILEAGHVHGVFTATDDHCALCQHSIVLDKALENTILLVIPLLLAALAISIPPVFISCYRVHFALIRAPPPAPHSR